MRRSEILLSSLWEEVGFVIVEAALNTLISSDCPTVQENFRNGQNGFLFK